MHWSFFTGFSYGFRGVIQPVASSEHGLGCFAATFCHLRELYWRVNSNKYFREWGWKHKKRSVNHRKQRDGNEIFQTNFLLFPRIRLNTVQLCFPLSEVSLRRKKIQLISLHLINFQIAKFYTVFAVLDEVLRSRFSSILQLNH